MAKSLFSPSWYRVAELKLRLRRHAEIHRQKFRGEIWYVLQDHQTGRFHRLSASANLMISLMDGRRTLHEIWDLVGRRAGDDPPTQDEAIHLLAELHASDLLQGELPPDFQELSDRSAKQARNEVMNRLRNPMALRLPLFDPDRWLDLTMPLVRPLFTVYGLLAWLALVGTGIALAVLHWAELTSDASDRLLSAGNVALIIAIYPLVKTFHEAGHAYATKAWGGAVHEVGIMLLIFVPAPYVDATSSTAFREKWRRIVVSSAGIMVEFALAAAAMIFWVNAEPGLARAAAFNVMVIGGVSTLFFNGNPLLRFDGYYIFADLIEVPNLGTRANRYFWYLVQRYCLGIANIDNPASAPGERKWLFGYAVLSFCYRIMLSLTIALLVATKLFFIGTLLALFTVFGTVVMPVFKGLKFLTTTPRLQGQRGRAITLVGTAVAGLATLILFVPMPYGTVAQGVVWIPDRAEVRADTAGIVAEILSPPDSMVSAGTPLLRLEDPGISGRVALIEAQRHELQLRYEAVRFSDRVEADVVLEQIKNMDGVLASVKQRRDGLVVSAHDAGRFILPKAANLPGRFLNQGDLVGYVVSSATPQLRVIVPQSEVDLVRARTDSVDVRYAGETGAPVPAHISREVPAAQFDLPSLALSVEGGGTVAMRSGGQAGDKPRTLEGLFVFDVAPERAEKHLLLGSRVFVRFGHGSEPLIWRWVRSVRQTFLSRFNV
ncbi:PqqD family peptide modification chaperone [Mesorhizobium neociceri]|uniref:PqqD family peptide modification chaperone n=1 Tax=Mesorhizobium neociceri TaxID=1307853 RepID=A0A838B6E6_9HYPH|nr:PqqD family peptide modification chaperone [Mesorhizobium neociceri]MBA1141284.1 PqqD family peptide modification chaperone [Mesorhizobium neociceri]